MFTPSFRDAPKGVGPESFHPSSLRSMDSGFGPADPPRQDGAKRVED
jgi:hypothetical protein